MTNDSSIINALKTVKERIGHNYTSYQLLTILDRLLFRGLKPIIETTDFFDRILACVIGWAATNPRRKLSALPRSKFNTYVMAYIVESDPKIKFKIASRMKLERNIIFYTLHRFLELTADLNCQHPDKKLIRSLRVTNPNQLWFAKRGVSYWTHKAESFKHMMLEKYYRLIMNEAQLYHKQQLKDNPGVTFELEEVAQNFVLAASKAIDKCDANQGTLTSYVQIWLKDAKNTAHFRPEYGTAYSLPASRRRTLAEMESPQTNNFSVSIDAEELKELESDTDTEGEAIRKDEIALVRQLAKLADPSGISRLFLGIGELLNDSELSQLEAITVNNSVSTE